MGDRSGATPGTRSGSSGSRSPCRAPILPTGTRARRHAGHGWSRRRPRGGHARVPAVRRRPHLRVRRVGRARPRPRSTFLPRAVELCPTVVFAQTKTDLYPAWERIVEINKGHLGARGHRHPRRRGRRTRCVPKRWRSATTPSNEQSGFPEMIEAFGDQRRRAGEGTRRRSASNEATSARSTELVRVGSKTRSRCSPTGPSAAEARRATSKRATETPRAPTWPRRASGASSSATVSRTCPTTSASGSARRMRTISRRDGRAVEELKSAKEWDDIGARACRPQVADEVADVFVGIEEGAAATSAPRSSTLLRGRALVVARRRGRRDDAVDVGDAVDGKAARRRRRRPQGEARRPGSPGLPRRAGWRS